MIEQISGFFADLGVPPLVAGMMVGMVFGFLLRGILKSEASNPPRPGNAAIGSAGAPAPAPMNLSAGMLDFGNLKLLASVEADIRDALNRGSKIEAIKILREATGLGLKESKDLIEALEARRF